MIVVEFDPEVLAFGGSGFGPLAEATLGTLFELEVVPSAVTPYAGRPQFPVSATSSRPIAWPRETILDEALLERLAANAAELALSPEIQTWTSAVLSRAGRAGEPLDTDVDIARVLLRESQRLNATEETRVLNFTASALSIGLPAAIVAHDMLSLLAAVYASKRWYYADPNKPLPFGEVFPFGVEKIVRVPDIAVPKSAKQEEERNLAWEEHEKRWTELEATWEKQTAEIQALISSIGSTPRTVVVRREFTPAQKLLLVGVTGLALYAIWRTARHSPGKNS